MNAKKRPSRWKLEVLFLLAFCFVSIPAAETTAGLDDRPKGEGFQVEQQADRLLLSHSGQPIAEFVFRDKKILRPYFSNLHTLGGAKVTRNHPPVAGKDETDHDTMHPGIWMGFGDISGADFWRNKGKIEHVRFIEEARDRNGRLTFATENVFLTESGNLLGSLTNRFAVILQSNGWFIIWEASVSPATDEMVLGDQEEMGFGARVATEITEKKGGIITSSTGLKTAKRTWGQAADWCDYSGQIDGKPVGITLMAHPTNFRQSWWHNRDYGLLVANPFGREAMKQGAKSSVAVRKGETLWLRFGASIHSGREYSPAKAYESFLQFIDQN